MLIRRFVVWMLPLGLMVPGAGVVCSQDFPNKPIRMVTSAPGGGGDFVVRLIAHRLSGSFGQQVVVDNRGIIAAEIVAKAPPDGYTLLFYGSTILLLPFLRDNVPFDPVRDFSPITLAASSPYILVVHPSLPVRSVTELISLAKARPGQLDYGSAGSGSSTHIAAELFMAMARVNIMHVPYRGAGPALISLIGGEVHLMFATAGSVAPHIKSGRLRALAVSSAQPSALVPSLPTVAASGLPGYESIQMYGVFTPAKTSAMTINRLNLEIVRVINRADVKEKFLNAGVEAVGSSPEEFAAKIKSEMARLGKVIKDAGIRVE